jgi:hypothetical protein
MKRGERVVTIVGRDAMDALALFDGQHQARTAKSCGPGAPGLVLSLARSRRRPYRARRAEFRKATVTKRSWTPGRARNKSKTIAQGMSMFRLHLWWLCLCAFSIRTQGFCRCSQTPGIPCALVFFRRTLMQSSGVMRRGNAKLWLESFRGPSFETRPVGRSSG